MTFRYNASWHNSTGRYKRILNILSKRDLGDFLTFITPNTRFFQIHHLYAQGVQTGHTSVLQCIMVIELFRNNKFLNRDIQILIRYMFAVCQFLARVVIGTRTELSRTVTVYNTGDRTCKQKNCTFTINYHYQISVELAGWFGRCKTRMGWTSGVVDRGMPLQTRTKHPNYQKWNCFSSYNITRRIPWRRFLVDKLAVLQLAKKLPAS
jgi:hypothetical protein